MQGHARVLRPFVAIMIVLVMVTSASASAVGPMLQASPAPVKIPTWQERIGIENQGDASRADGRAEFEDYFEIVNPYPTTKGIYDLKYRPSSNEILLVGEQGLVMVYDGVYFNVVPTGVTVNLWTIAWRPQGDYALIGGDNGELYKFQNGRMQRFYMGTSSMIRDIDFCPDGNRAVIVTDTAVYMFQDNAVGGAVSYLGTFDPVYFVGVSFHPSDDSALLVGYEIVQNANGYHWEGRVYRYDERAGTFTNLGLKVPTDRDTDLYAVDWSPLGDIALIAGWNGYVVSWDGTSFGTVSTSTYQTFLSVEFNGKGQALLAGFSGELYLYSNGNFNGIQTGMFNTLYGVDWSNDGSAALMCGDAAALASYDPSTGTVTRLNLGTNTTFFDVAWKPDWSYALLVGSGGAVVKWDGTKLTDIDSPTTETLLGVAFGPNGDRALIVGTGGTLLEYFDGGVGGSPSMVQRLSGSTQNLWDVDFNNDGVALLVGDRGEVRTWTNNNANRVVTTTIQNLRSVDWKDASTAYIVGGGGTVLRYQSSPIGRVDVSTPNNLPNNMEFWGGQWKDDKQRGLLCGAFGLLLEHIENNDLTTLDDSYNMIETGVSYTLYDMGWNYDETDVLMPGDAGHVLTFHDENDAVRTLTSPSISPLYGVAWKANQYALVVGGDGTVMKYWPNLKPQAVTLDNPTQITDNSMKLTWSRSDIGDFHHYEVHMSKTSGFNPSASTRLKTLMDQDTTSYVVTGLARDTTYYFKVRVVDNGGLYANSNEVYGHTIVGKLPPAAVKLYDPTDITDSSMSLSWDQNKDTDFDHYELHMSKTKGFTPSGSTVKVSVDNQTKTSTPVQGLAVETTYYFKLRVVDKEGMTNDSNEVSGTTQKINIAPSAVKVNEPFNVTDDTMEVNWSQNTDSDFKQYEVHMSTVQGFAINASTLKATIKTQNLTYYKFEGLSQLTNYYIKVRVVDTGLLFSDSNEVTAKTKEFNAAPNPVKLNDPTNITESVMDLTWSKNNDTDFAMYEIHVANDANFIPNQSTMVDRITSQNLTKYKLTGLTPGTTYFIKVRVYDFADQFADSNEVFGKTIGNEPPEAVMLNVTGVEQYAVSLTWTKNNDTDFAKYEIYYSKDDQFTPDPASLFGSYGSPNTRTARVDKLELNTTYFFVVRVVDDLGAHADSNMVTATTVGPDLPPRAVVLGEPFNITRASMEFEWGRSPDRDFSAYEIHKSEKAGFKPSDSTRVVKIIDQNLTHYNATGLKMNTEYHFIVRVFDVAQQTNDSNEVFAKTRPPNQPPIADAGQDINAYTGDMVELKGIGIDPDGKVVKYEWDFEGDGIFDYSNTMTGEIKQQYMKSGSFMPTLRVTDNEGATASDTTNITIVDPPSPNKPPKANAGPDQTVYVEQTVTFEGTATDDDGTIKLYEWDFNGDGNYDWSSTDDGMADHTYPDEGTYKARLRVMDDLNATSTDVAIITVNPKNHAPKAVISKPMDGKKYNNIDPVQFDASGTSDQDGDLMTYKWIDESDGEKLLSTKFKFSTVLTKLGTHTITLEVSDGVETGTETVDITVQEPTNKIPTITITDPARGASVKGTVVISGRATDEDGTIAEVCVRVDGGACTKATGKTDWTFEWNTANVEAGLHTLKAVVTDDRGDTADSSITLTVVKKKTGGTGFLGLPGFEAPLMLAAAALVALAVASRKKKDE